jgi:hypothetical protein
MIRDREAHALFFEREMEATVAAARRAILADRYAYNQVAIPRQASVGAASEALRAFTAAQRDYVDGALTRAELPAVPLEVSPALSALLPALVQACVEELAEIYARLDVSRGLEQGFMEESANELKTAVLQDLFPIEADLPPIFRHRRRREPAPPPPPPPPPPAVRPNRRRLPPGGGYYYDDDDDEDDETDTDDRWFMGSQWAARAVLP